MKNIRIWIHQHEHIVLISTVLFILFFYPHFSGYPNFIILLFFFGIAPVFGLGRGFASIFTRSFALSRKDIIRAILISLFLLTLSPGIILFILMFIAEFYIQLTCSGAGCAQGCIGVFMFTIIAWINYLILLTVNRYLINHAFWPNQLQPDFSYKKKQF